MEQPEPANLVSEHSRWSDDFLEVNTRSVLSGVIDKIVGELMRLIARVICILSSWRKLRRQYLEWLWSTAERNRNDDANYYGSKISKRSPGTFWKAGPYWRDKRSSPVVICLLLSKMLLAVECALEESPSNTVATIGSSDVVVFRCSSNEGKKLQWFRQPNDTSERQTLYQRSLDPKAQLYSRVLNGRPGKFYLYLETKPEAAQTYTCLEPGNEEVSAELILIGSTRTEKAVNGSHVILTCVVEFRGNWAPELEWSLDDGTAIVDEARTFVVPNGNVSRILIIPAIGYDRNYTCRISFDIKGKPQQTTNTVVPNYRSTSILRVEEIKHQRPLHERQSSNSGGNTITEKMLIGIIFTVAAAFLKDF